MNADTTKQNSIYISMCIVSILLCASSIYGAYTSAPTLYQIQKKCDDSYFADGHSRRQSVGNTLHGMAHYYEYSLYERTKTVDCLKKAAHTGDVAAMHLLGIRYKKQKRPREAAHFFHMAAQRALPSSKFQLGILYAQHGGWHEALACLEPLTQNASYRSDALKKIALIYHQLGRTTDAMKILVSFAKTGDVTSIYNLGIMLGTDGQLEKATYCLKRAADFGDTWAAIHLFYLKQTSKIEIDNRLLKTYIGNIRRNKEQTQRYKKMRPHFWHVALPLMLQIMRG